MMVKTSNFEMPIEQNIECQMDKKSIARNVIWNERRMAKT